MSGMSMSRRIFCVALGLGTLSALVTGADDKGKNIELEIKDK